MAHDLIEGDNVDVTLMIGENEWEIIDAEIVLNNRSTPDIADVLVTPARGSPLPSTPQKFEDNGGEVGKNVSLEVDTELSVRREGVSEESTIFENWQVANMTATGEYTYEAIFHDPSQQPFQSDSESPDATNLMNSTVVIQPGSSQIIESSEDGPYSNVCVAGERKVRVSELVNIIIEESKIDDYVVNIAQDGIIVGYTEAGTEIRKGYDPEITFSSWELPVKKVLDRAEAASQSHWWFDREGTFHFGPPLPDTDISAYSLKYIKEASDGKVSPPYQSVQVIGDGVASEEGWSRGALLNEQRINANGKVDIDTDAAELLDPVFTYRNMEINTQGEADNIREDILEELRSQQAEGEVTVVGFPELRPLDRIDMPNTDRQPMGGESYGVKEITHRLNTSDGFITKIKVGGLLDTQQVVSLDGEGLTVEDVELEAQWTDIFDGFMEFMSGDIDGSADATTGF